MVVLLTVLPVRLRAVLLRRVGAVGNRVLVRFSKARWTLVCASTATAASMRTDGLAPDVPPPITRAIVALVLVSTRHRLRDGGKRQLLLEAVRAF